MKPKFTKQHRWEAPGWDALSYAVSIARATLKGLPLDEAERILLIIPTFHLYEARIEETEFGYVIHIYVEE